MPDSLPMLQDIAALVEALPTTGGGFRVENPEAFAVEVIGVVAPVYQTDIDAITVQRDTAQSLAEQRASELSLLRNDVDQLRSVIASVVGSLNNGDITSAQAVLATI